MITVTSKMFQAISFLFQVELSLSTAQVYDHKLISNFLFQGNNFDICGVAAIFTVIWFTRKRVNVTDIGLPKVMWEGFLFSPVMSF